MHLSVRIPSAFAAVALVLCVLPGAGAQSSSSSTTQRAVGSSSEQQTTGTGTYIVIDPLAKVRYDNRYDISLGMAYDHMKAGPNLLSGANLGGLDLEGSYWLTKRWGAEGTVRYYLGTSGAAPNPYAIEGPFVSELFYGAGPEWLGPHNKHGDIIAHLLIGGVNGNFEQNLRGQPPSVVGFYPDQNAFAGIIGGHMDLNRNEHWVFRVTPDAVLTRYSINYGDHGTYNDVNFAISVGVSYKFTKKKR